MLSAVSFLSLYFSSLVMFSFVSHPVVYCVLLMLSALGVSGYVYSVVGFSWYLVLFCLVYVGGVYVLFVFVSVYSPNPSPVVSMSWLLFFSSFFFFFGMFSFSSFCFPAFVESSHYLCSFFEGFSYCVYCLILMIGFVGVSVVVSSKDAFFR
uniref:NADH dehydrogenase subunit 6 n=1 Tax=Diplodiscus japonicus TaxID=1895467 RepID=A0A977R6G6_9TREM|nr:NADH dehydrogenase subunit 6 [Diplodiscus japonicus]UXL86286.1 NADH dehydrogenase subunit 6 [Diplodiscus japonicus]